jgi:hypothetical protein
VGGQAQPGPLLQVAASAALRPGNQLPEPAGRARHRVPPESSVVAARCAPTIAGRSVAFPPQDTPLRTVTAWFVIVCSFARSGKADIG